jgi:hypothetical protein
MHEQLKVTIEVPATELAILQAELQLFTEDSGPSKREGRIIKWAPGDKKVVHMLLMSYWHVNLIGGDRCSFWVSVDRSSTYGGHIVTAAKFVTMHRVGNMAWKADFDGAVIVRPGKPVKINIDDGHALHLHEIG